MISQLWRSNVSLRRHNTLALEATSGWYSRPANVQAMAADIRLAKKQRIPVRILGQGSNVVLQDFAGLTLTPGWCGVEVKGNQHEAIVCVGSSVDWPTFVAWCCKNKLHGLENLAMIPGSTGAAPIQNIGAYGLEIAERLVAVDAFDIKHHKLVRYTSKECNLSYRNSLFKARSGEFIICALYLRLGSMHEPVLTYERLAYEVAKRGGQPRDIFAAVCRLRIEKLPNPKKTPNAGSFFKNPSLSREAFIRLKKALPAAVGFAEAGSTLMRVSAAVLIEACGWRGKGLERVGFSEQHALTLVNLGQATARDVCQLASRVCDDVQVKFGVRLEQETVLL